MDSKKIKLKRSGSGYFPVGGNLPALYINSDGFNYDEVEITITPVKPYNERLREARLNAIYAWCRKFHGAYPAPEKAVEIIERADAEFNETEPNVWDQI